MQELPLTLYRAEQVRELDRIAIQEFGIPCYALMCRAGVAVCNCIAQKWPEARTLAVFCGSGNNAGDGYVVARLALEAGISAKAISVGNPETLKGDALTACSDYLQSGGTLSPYEEGLIIEADLIVDALLGTGLDRTVTGIYADAIQTINKAQIPVIAVDIPSGLNSDTGEEMGAAVQADYTVTFIGLKQGLFTGQAADYAGEIVYDSLAVPDDVFDLVKSSVFRVSQMPLMPRQRCAHKGNMGHVLVVGGDLGYSGAARMAGEAALRIGAGLVTIATRSEHAGLLNLNRPELMVRGVASYLDIENLLDKANVVVLGPGLGTNIWGKELFDAVLMTDKPTVL
ncbi:MAG TPA: NAD(P)H-hydrate epimerase, partial [Methylomicrobium sp.]|nr:NAD(P)H-hydrate epimerase [Methylomicrobium sp.]